MVNGAKDTDGSGIEGVAVAGRGDLDAVVGVEDLDARIAGRETSRGQPSDDALDHRVRHLPGGDALDGGRHRCQSLKIDR